MKIQDIGFFILLIMLIFLRRPTLFVWAGLLSLILAIPFFATWVFFTAQRLVWYAAAFFFVFTIFSLLESRKVQ